MVYFSISVLINTCFFSTIQRYMMNDVHFAGQVDSSLLEVMLENLLGMEDAGISVADDADDIPASVDYLSTRTSLTLSMGEGLNSSDLPAGYHCPSDPMLKISTPPPRG
jgi:hypothetical protein